MIRKITDEKSWFIDWTNQWTQLWEKCNWYDFDLLWVRFENDMIMGGYEATFIVLGLGFRWRWNHTRTQQMEECERMVEEIQAGTAKTVPWMGVTTETVGDIELSEPYMPEHLR